MKAIDCTPERHGEAIRAIYNDAILNTVALYDYAPRSIERVREQMEAHARAGFPWIGFEDEHGALMAFGTYGEFRAWEGYKYTVEHSVYVNRRFRRRGLGLLVLQELEARARKQGLHVMVGCIDSGHVASIRLHEKAGFALCGRLPQTGFKFGVWRDILFYDKILTSQL